MLQAQLLHGSLIKGQGGLIRTAVLDRIDAHGPGDLADMLGGGLVIAHPEPAHSAFKHRAGDQIVKGGDRGKIHPTQMQGRKITPQMPPKHFDADGAKGLGLGAEGIIARQMLGEGIKVAQDAGRDLVLLDGVKARIVAWHGQRDLWPAQSRMLGHTAVPNAADRLVARLGALDHALGRQGLQIGRTDRIRHLMRGYALMAAVAEQTAQLGARIGAQRLPKNRPFRRYRGLVGGKVARQARQPKGLAHKGADVLDAAMRDIQLRRVQLLHRRANIGHGRGDHALRLAYPLGKGRQARGNVAPA